MKPISALRMTSARGVLALFNARSITSTTIELAPAASGTVAVQLAKLSVLVASTPLTRTEVTGLAASLAVPRTINSCDEVRERAVGNTTVAVGGVTSIELVTVNTAAMLPTVSVAATTPPGVAADVTRTTTVCALLTVPAALVKAAPLTERSEEHTSELQSQSNLVCRLLLEKKKKKRKQQIT